ncbi:MAG: hypothetical protein AB7E47_17510 [Desulfovibrionaceae bacterium]
MSKKYVDKDGNEIKLLSSEEVYEVKPDGRLVRATSRKINALNVKTPHQAAISLALSNAKTALADVADSNTAIPVLEALVEGYGQVVKMLLGSDALGGE